MLNATVIRRIDITKDLIILHVKPDAGVPDFSAGQYVALALSEGAPTTGQKEKFIKRAYSIGSPPQQKEYLEFYIAVVADGTLTPKVASLKEGERIHVTPKITGVFTLKEVPPEANLVMVSTGTGIAPYMSMLRTPETWREGRQICILHGVRYSSDLAYAEELRSLEKERSGFRYLPIVSRPGDEWSGQRGYVQQYFKDGTVNLDPAKDHVLLCGNPAMIEEVEKLLTEKGYKEHTRKSPGNLHLEKYW